MCFTAVNNKETVEVLIGGERIQVDRKMIIKESKFFYRFLSKTHYKTVTIGLETTVAAFETVLKICQREENCITKDNYSQISSLAELLECGSVISKCADFFANMSDDDEVFIALNILEKIVQMDQQSRPAHLQQYFERVFCPEFIMVNRKHLHTISPEAKNLLMDLMIDNITQLSAHVDWTEEEAAKMKKLERKNSILESKLMKTLNDVRVAQDQLKSSKDAKSELAKLKKKLSAFEKKTNSLKDEMKKLTTNLALKSKNFERSKKEFALSLETEKKSFENSIEELKESLIIEKETKADEQLKLQTELSCSKEALARLQVGNQPLRGSAKPDAQPSEDDFSNSEWNRMFNPSSFRSKYASSDLATSTIGDWERTPLWTNYDLLFL